MAEFPLISAFSFQKRFLIILTWIDEYNRVFCNELEDIYWVERVDLFEDCSFEQCGRAYFDKIAWKVEQEQKDEKGQ